MICIWLASFAAVLLYSALCYDCFVLCRFIIIKQKQVMLSCIRL